VAAVEITRAQALAHRVIAQGLDRPTGVDVKDLPVWDLGLQDSPAGSAALSLASRVPGGFDAVPDLADRRRFTTVWGTRGAPLTVRSGDVADLAAALWPLDAADAVSRLSGNGQQFRKNGQDPIEAIRVAAEAMAGVVDRPMTKGEVSTEVSAIIPDEYITWCRGCQAHHLGDQLMRVAALPAGLRLVPGATPATLEPIPGWKGVVHDQVGAEGLVRSYLQLYGPTAAPDVGAYFQTSGKAVSSVWPDGLVEVRLEGRKAWVPEEDLDALLGAEPTSGLVRVLPRSDPWLLARDRELTVPDAASRKVLWPVIGWPGAVLVDGEVVASWRVKGSGTKVAMTVDPFGKLTKKVTDEIAREAHGIAAQRSVDDLAITYG